MFNFETNLSVDNLDTVPAEFHGLYAKGADGKFSVTDEARGIVDAYTGVTKTLGTEQKAKKNANDEAAARRVTLKAIKEIVQQKLGVTIDDEAVLGDTLSAQIDTLLGKVNGGEALKVDLAKLKTQFDTQVGEATKASDAKVEKMKGSLEKYLRDGAAAQALAGANVVSPDLLMPHVQSQVKVLQNGDDFIAAVVDAEGNTRINSKGSPMTVAELVTEMKANPMFAPAFKSDTKAGGGKEPGSGKRPALPAAKGDDRSATDKIQAGIDKLGKK